MSRKLANSKTLFRALIFQPSTLLRHFATLRHQRSCRCRVSHMPFARGKLSNGLTAAEQHVLSFKQLNIHDNGPSRV